MSKRVLNCLAVVLLFLTCTSCKAIEPYLIKDYLNTLSKESGISNDENIDETYNNLINWQIINADDLNHLEEELNYSFLNKTITKLIDTHSNEDEIKKRNWIKQDIKDEDLIGLDIAEEIIEKAVKEINNKEFKEFSEITLKDNVKKINVYKYKNGRLETKDNLSIGDIVYVKEINEYKKIIGLENGSYLLSDASFDETLESMKIENTYEIDFEEAIDIPGGIVEDNTSYVNNKRDLLASDNKSKVFNTDGFRVSYNFNSSGIHGRISKNINGVNAFFDVSIANIRPSYKWDFEKGTIKDAYFKVDYKATTQLGVSIGKYNKYYLDLKDKDSSSFINSLKSIIKKKDDEIESTIKICEIKTPVPNVPTAYFNIDVLARIYTSGKVDVILYSTNSLGLEIRDGNFRTINDSTKDLDLTIGGSSRAIVGVNFNLEAVKSRLMDIEIDAGVRAAVTTTAHLYDEEGNKQEVIVDYPYSSADELSKENENVKMCGDVSLNWVLDLKINTSKALLSKFGFSKTIEILDENDQVFGNKTHIENGVFVKKCTRKSKPKTSSLETTQIVSDKIILSKYSVVVKMDGTYKIPIKALPKGYKESDLVYTSINNSIASVSSDGEVKGLDKGACEIKIATSDGKYTASINILISSEK